MPFNSLGAVPVFEAVRRSIKVYAIKENSTVLNVTNSNFFKSDKIIEVETYKDCLVLV